MRNHLAAGTSANELIVFLSSIYAFFETSFQMLNNQWSSRTFIVEEIGRGSVVAPQKIVMGICRSWSRSLRTLDYAEPTLFDRILCPSLNRLSNRKGMSVDDGKSARKGLNATSGAQFAALPWVKPVVWFARTVVNWRSRSVTNSAISFTGSRTVWNILTWSLSNTICLKEIKKELNLIWKCAQRDYLLMHRPSVM